LNAGAAAARHAGCNATGNSTRLMVLSGWVDRMRCHA
jgi:hypothetical protein